MKRRRSGFETPASGPVPLLIVLQDVTLEEVTRTPVVDSLLAGSLP